MLFSLNCLLLGEKSDNSFLINIYKDDDSKIILPMDDANAKVELDKFRVPHVVFAQINNKLKSRNLIVTGYGEPNFGRSTVKYFTENDFKDDDVFNEATYIIVQVLATTVQQDIISIVK
ncbi:hypothetical protein GLOIN_2v810277 [Rhizophagus clarus]|uniref:Uncharacterized protein n=1 Tax=Rhizophagus clarus TaxID=94130 RepID=A0A8H3QMZ5_9GLOM|nr:hypothetical protein GLOIN_2v810277 [Rhizophagus clarus]